MTPEGKVKAGVTKFLDALGNDCWYFMPMMMGYGRKGIPDIVGCYKGQFFAIECKAEGKAAQVTPWQEREARDIATAQGMCCLVDNSSTAKAGHSLKPFREWLDAIQ